MIFRPTQQNRTWYRLLCLLLALAMVVAPIVSAVAEQHDSQHITQSDHHFDDYGSSDLHADAQQSDNTEKDSGLHALAHISHCCSLTMAVLPSSLDLYLSAIVSTLSVNITPSRHIVLKISHFRPPIL